MNMKVARILLFILILAFSGCVTTSSERAVPSEPALPDPVVRQSSGTADEHHSKELLALARDRLESGNRLLEESGPKNARREFEAGLAILARIDTDELPSKIINKKDELTNELCLRIVTTHRLRYGFPIRSIERKFDSLDFEFHPEVERWLIYWLTSGHKLMDTYLSRSGRYIDQVKRIIAEEGLPEDIAYLPLIESGYSPLAYSRAHAVGVWQFIASTAKIYNLRIDSFMDERRDVDKATRAACAYLRKLRNQFGSWQLALAAYNCGEARVASAIKKNGHRANYWELELPYETKNYLPKFYSALMIAKDPEYFGFHVSYMEPMNYATLNLERPIDLKLVAEKTGLGYGEIKSYNPELLTQVTHPKINNYPLKIPVSNYKEFVTKFERLPQGEKYLSAKRIQELTTKTRLVIHVVKKGDSLYRIARKYNTTVTKLKKWNRIKRGNRIYPGDRIKIYIKTR